MLVREALLRLEVEAHQAVPKKGALCPARLRSGDRGRGLYGNSWRNTRSAQAVPASPRLIARLEELLAQQKEQAAAGDLAGAAVTDRCFHAEIVRSGGNEILSRLYDQLRDRQLRMGVAVMHAHPDRITKTLTEHEAIRASPGDAEAAVDIVHGHAGAWSNPARERSDELPLGRLAPRDPPGGRRAIGVWGIGVSVYFVAVIFRTSLGVAGLLHAADRFHVNASALSTFSILQLLVYAGMQIPVGLLVDGNRHQEGADRSAHRHPRAKLGFRVFLPPRTGWPGLARAAGLRGRHDVHQRAAAGHAVVPGAAGAVGRAARRSVDGGTWSPPSSSRGCCTGGVDDGVRGQRVRRSRRPRTPPSLPEGPPRGA